MPVQKERIIDESRDLASNGKYLESWFTLKSAGLPDEERKEIMRKNAEIYYDTVIEETNTEGGIEMDTIKYFNAIKAAENFGLGEEKVENAKKIYFSKLLDKCPDEVREYCISNL